MSSEAYDILPLDYLQERRRLIDTGTDAITLGSRSPQYIVWSLVGDVGRLHSVLKTSVSVIEGGR